MKLYTTTQYKQLLKNGQSKNREKDFKPVVKYKVTGTPYVCYINKLDTEDPNWAFGFRNRKNGYHYGWFVLGDLVMYKDEFYDLERDLSFKATETLDDIVNRCRRTTGIEIVVG